MGFVEVMKERGMLAQVTHEEELVTHLNEKPRTAYVGFDPTASSLHIGHLLPVLAARRWQQAGHRIVVLVGGGTALIGDPTGKTEMRKMDSVDEIDRRIDLIKEQLSRFIDFSDESKGVLVNNADWLRDLSYLPFLRDIGKHFSVNRMLTAECFKQRMEKGLSFLEFNYMILQSYDFYHLNKTYGCTVQIGGDDQWSNMLGGMDLIRRISSEQAYCFTLSLLTNSQGKKMGKTENGAIWLEADKTSPYELFQYFRNVEDDMVEKCLMYFSDLPVDEVKRLGALSGGEINEAKQVLAFEATKLLHGTKAAEESKERAQSLFSQGGGQNAPEVVIQASDVNDEVGILDFLMLSKVFASKADLRRLIQQNGLSLDGKKVTDPKTTFSKSDLSKPEGILMQKGKKHFYRLFIR